MVSTFEWGRFKPWLLAMAVASMCLVGLATNWARAQEAAAPAETAAAPAADATATAKPDPTGADTGGVSDVTTDPLTLNNIADRVGKNKLSINIVWTLITGFLVMFMQAGFAMVETGLTRAKTPPTRWP